ncbi:MAG: radical SAM protein [Promethearchaeota archaeon CR_4]|nr:MAG: radical SAM protein [Candidatus Lokiarchaeota archaeon CR_4]
MSVNLALTRCCNQSCLHCYVNAGGARNEGNNELGLEDWIAVVKECRDQGYEHVHIFGGEPFLVSFLPDLCDAIDDCGMAYNIATNGCLLKPTDYGWLQNTGGSLVVSVFGGEKFHDAFTGAPQSYFRARETIRTCLARGVNASVATCLMRRNMEEYSSLIKEFADMGVEEFFVLHFSPIGRGEALFEEAIEPAMWYTFYLRLKQILPAIRQAVRHEVEILFELATYPTDNPATLHFTQEVMPCPLPRHLSLTIDWTGRVFPCILFLNNPSWALGILQHQPLEKILKELTFDWYNQHVKQNRCPSCRYYGKCQGGCPAYTLGMLRDFRCSDLKYLPFCPIRVIPV